MTDNNNEVGNIVQSHPIADTGRETTESDNSVCPISSLKEALPMKSGGTNLATRDVPNLIDVYGNNFIFFDNNTYSILLDGYYILSMSIVITSNFNKMLLYIKNKLNNNLNLHEKSPLHFSLNLGYEENNNGVKLIKYFSYKIFELNDMNINNEQIFLNTICTSIYVNKLYIKIKIDNYKEDNNYINIIDDINNYNTSIILLRCKNK